MAIQKPEGRSALWIATPPSGLAMTMQSLNRVYGSPSRNRRVRNDFDVNVVGSLRHHPIRGRLRCPNREPRVGLVTALEVAAIGKSATFIPWIASSLRSSR